MAFKNGDLLTVALVHSSYLNENPGAFDQPNERLEFLGDALIGLVAADELYRRHPDWPEGELTGARSALVRGETLAQVGETLDLGRYLLMGRGEEASGGRERPSNLAAAVEAVVGALFLDQGYGVAHDLVLRLLSTQLAAVDQVSTAISAKSALQEAVQGQGLEPPSYRTVEASGPDHAREFTAEVTVSGRVLGRGTGRRKALAEEQAAREALDAMSRET